MRGNKGRRHSSCCGRLLRSTQRFCVTNACNTTICHPVKHSLKYCCAGTPAAHRAAAINFESVAPVGNRPGATTVRLVGLRLRNTLEHLNGYFIRTSCATRGASYRSRCLPWQRQGRRSTPQLTALLYTYSPIYTEVYSIISPHQLPVCTSSPCCQQESDFLSTPPGS